MLRRLAFGAIAVAVGLAVLLASCLLLDPPPALPTLPLQAPTILTGSLVPPNTSVVNWTQDSETLDFVVPVAVDDPTTRFAAYAFEDYGFPTSQLVYSGESTPNADGGPVQLINFSVSPPPPSGCHTFTFFADADDNTAVNPVKAGLLDCLLCQQVTWFYEPTGGGDCPALDAGGIPDADLVREGGADAADASLGAMTMDR
jgi:hypothetical protein